MTNLLEMTKTTGRSLRLVIVAALFVGLARADGGGALGWPTLGRVLRCGDDGEFAALVRPLSVAVNLSYVATHGSYFDPAAANETTLGDDDAWTKAIE